MEFRVAELVGNRRCEFIERAAISLFGQIEEKNRMSSATSSVHTARGGRPETCYALIAVRATVTQLFSKLSDRLAFPGGVPVPAQSLCVVACAVRRELIALLHTDTWPLVLSAAIGALVVVACIYGRKFLE
jgi:hypothetical protein